MSDIKTYRIHYFGKGKRRTINEWENFPARNSDEAKEKAMSMAKKVKEIHQIDHLWVDVNELQLVTYFELN